MVMLRSHTHTHAGARRANEHVCITRGDMAPRVQLDPSMVFVNKQKENDRGESPRVNLWIREISRAFARSINGV